MIATDSNVVDLLLDEIQARLRVAESRMEDRKVETEALATSRLETRRRIHDAASSVTSYSLRSYRRMRKRMGLPEWDDDEASNH